MRQPMQFRTPAAQKQYNFKVKVNYQNGAVTVHGPQNSLQPVNTVRAPSLNHNRLQSNISHHSNNNLLYNSAQSPMILNKKPFSFPNSYTTASTASQPNIYQVGNKKLLKTNSDTFNLQFPINKPVIRAHSQAIPYAQNYQKIGLQLQQQVHCVICQRKFSRKQFDFHLQIHRNARKIRKVQQKTLNPQINQQNKITQQPLHIQQTPKLQKVNQNSNQKQSTPDQLYTFQFNNNSFRKPESSRNSNSLQIRQFNIKGSDIISQNSSFLRSLDSRNSKNQTPLAYVQSGIRYLNNPSYNNLHQNQNTLNSNIPLINPTNNIAINTSFSSYQDLNGNLVSKRFDQNGLPLNIPLNENSQISKPNAYSIRSSQFSMPHLRKNLDSRSFQNSRENKYQNVYVLGHQQKNNFHASNNIKNGINPFNLIQSQSQQSKIYQYFPQPGNQSLAQHRVHPSLPNNNNNNAFINNFHQQFQPPKPYLITKNPSSLNSSSHNLIFKPNQSGIHKSIELNAPYNAHINQLITHNTTHNNNNNININSNVQFSKIDHHNPDRLKQSSISSIHEYRQTLQTMGKEQIIKNYHSNKIKIDYNNIIGLSDALARQKSSGNIKQNFISSHRIKTENFSNCIQPNITSSSKTPKTMTAKSLIINNQQKNNLETSQISNVTILDQLGSRAINQSIKNLNSQNLQMIPIQGRQIFRGTQVEQDDLKGFQSAFSKSSKSTAKTKLPKNYLAVNDFINTNAGSQKK